MFFSGNYRNLLFAFLAACPGWLLLTGGCRTKDRKPASDSQDSSIGQMSPRSPAGAGASLQMEDPSIPGNFSSQHDLRFDSSRIAGFIRCYPLFKNLQKDLQQFYSGRSFAYAWYDRNGLIEQADNLFNRLMNIADEGLPDKIPYKDSLTAFFNASPAGQMSRAGHAQVENELMLTAQYFTYAKLAWQGLPESKTRSLNWFLPRKKIDLPILMDSLVRDSSSALIHSGYSYRQYALLRNYLKKYRELETSGKWPKLISVTGHGPWKPGDTAEGIRSIRNKLFLLGDLTDNSNSAVYDSVFIKGIKNYQQRSGMTADGIPGPATIRELNVPLATRIRTLIVNMERCRWVPVSLNTDYLIVNIPSFHLYAFEKDSLLFSMKAVVGKDVHKTVIFNGDLKYVVFSPYWNIPSGILKNEVLPAIKRDPGYLRKHNMEWSGKTLRQKPGPGNPLGLVKFLFPNSYDIYLHDTPAKGLFEQPDRAFSHGCIRLFEAANLARYLLRNDRQWTSENIGKAMGRGREQYVTLKKTVPVFIAYFTAWVDREGRLNLRKDIYKRDDRLAAMIAD